MRIQEIRLTLKDGQVLKTAREIDMAAATRFALHTTDSFDEQQTLVLVSVERIDEAESIAHCRQCPEDTTDAVALLRTRQWEPVEIRLPRERIPTI